MSRRSSIGSRAGAPVLHLDAFSGIAGNMFVAALLDAGLSRKELESQLSGLPLDFKVKISRVQRGPLAARYFDVRVPRKSSTGRLRYVSGNAPEKPLRGDGAHVHGRSFAQIRSLLNKAKLAKPVRLRALAIFEALARAEAKVHGTGIDEVQFHEVGAVDAIVDVTSAAIGLDVLGVSRVTCSPVGLGQGSVMTAHGRLPLPAPAALELLRGIPTEPAHVEWETVTPTGAAILRACVDEFRALPAIVIDSIGHGAGGEREGPMPNVLRAIVGRSSLGSADRVVVLETNIDDLVPEHFDHLMEELFEAGALDVSIQHIQMKKNRPGFGVRALAHPGERLAVARALFAHSTAIGVRTSECDRIILERDQRRVSTPFGRIGVKIVRDLDGAASVSAEYDDCKRAASKHDAKLRDVVRAAEDAARETLL